MVSVGEKRRFYCKKCGEPTTHVVKEIVNEGIVWPCLCCESSKQKCAILDK